MYCLNVNTFAKGSAQNGVANLRFEPCIKLSHIFSKIIKLSIQYTVTSNLRNTMSESLIQLVLSLDLDKRKPVFAVLGLKLTEYNE